MKRFMLAILLVLMMAVPAFAASVTVNLTLPTENCDGSTIGPLQDVVLHFDVNPRPAGPSMPGTPRVSSNPLCDTSSFTQYVYPFTEVVNPPTFPHVLQLGESEQERTFYVTASARTADGESVYSNEMSVVVPPLGLSPNPPVVINLTF